MAEKSGTMRRIAKKAVAAGRVHAAKVLLGEETLPELQAELFGICCQVRKLRLH